MMNRSLSDEDELKPGHLMMKMEPSQNTDLSARKMRQSGRHTFTSSVLNCRLGSIRVLFQSVCPRWFRWWRRSSADVTAVFKSMTSLHMTASPRSGPTPTENTAVPCRRGGLDVSGRPGSVRGRRAASSSPGGGWRERLSEREPLPERDNGATLTESKDPRHTRGCLTPQL